MKVEVRELRIGNLIGCDGNILIVEKIDIQNNIGYSLFEKSKGQHVNSGNKYYIPLTEEWLLRFRFKHTGNGFYIHIESLIELANIGDSFFHCGIKGVSLRNVHFVHELQNLYHALTGTELILK